MRVTVDIDSDNPLSLLVSLIKGTILCRRFPAKIRKTAKGYHIIWRGLGISKKKAFKWRLMVGDDWNRVRLDMDSPKRISQVLFSEKETHYYGYLFTKWLPSEALKRIDPEDEKSITECPFCGGGIEKSVKIWSRERKNIEIHHTDNDNICTIPLKGRFSFEIGGDI